MEPSLPVISGSSEPIKSAVEDDMQVFTKVKSNPAPVAIRPTSAPIHHHIAPAIGAPFMRADGLIHRGEKLVIC
jgi:hypothetical protein